MPARLAPGRHRARSRQVVSHPAAAGGSVSSFEGTPARALAPRPISRSWASPGLGFLVATLRGPLIAAGCALGFRRGRPLQTMGVGDEARWAMGGHGWSTMSCHCPGASRGSQRAHHGGQPREALMADSVTGRTYYENGQPVVVLVRWGGQISQNEPATGFIDAAAIRIRTGPRNVLVQRADGTKVVRPFRGLRRTPADDFPASGDAIR
jgi:hypothetical protein